MLDDKKTVFKHKVVVEQRELALLTGILDVISFDEESIIAETDLGIIILRGANLHVNRLNLDNGELDIDGEISSVIYEDTNSFSKGKASFLSKMFK